MNKHMAEFLKKYGTPYYALGWGVFATVMIVGAALLTGCSDVNARQNSSGCETTLSSRVSYRSHGSPDDKYRLVFTEYTTDKYRAAVGDYIILVDKDTYDSYVVGDIIFKPSGRVLPNAAPAAQ